MSTGLIGIVIDNRLIEIIGIVANTNLIQCKKKI